MARCRVRKSGDGPARDVEANSAASDTDSEGSHDGPDQQTMNLMSIDADRVARLLSGSYTALETICRLAVSLVAVERLVGYCLAAATHHDGLC